ncbi:MAG: hypothetical protein JO325_20990 [Solirubrobacterales bacterium]|nr:hypothetical protein [Solirubrobacterales bacterium]
MSDPDPAREQAEAAAVEAAAIGGRPSSEPPPQDEPDEAGRPVAEGGGGEAEGFEEAERELIEHTTHGDQHAARRAIEDAPGPGDSDDERAAQGGEADEERSSERDEDLS